MISLVVPTIRGREELFAKVVAEFKATTDADLEIITPRNYPTVGEAWNVGAEAATGDYLCLAADDMLPVAGWAEAAIAAADDGVYPAPWILKVDGSTECCGTLGSGLLLTEDARDGLPVCNSPVPFFRREQWAHLGPTLPVHCYSDDYLGYKARLIGLSVEVRREYKFVHLDGKVGRQPLFIRSGPDRETFAQEVSKL